MAYGYHHCEYNKAIIEVFGGLEKYRAGKWSVRTFFSFIFTSVFCGYTLTHHTPGERPHLGEVFSVCANSTRPSHVELAKTVWSKQWLIKGNNRGCNCVLQLLDQILN
jgi:hypothetical protein